MNKAFKFLIILMLIPVMCGGCSKKATSDNVHSTDNVDEVVTETDEEVITSLEKMEKFTFGYDQVNKDTAVIAGNFITNSTEILIEFIDLSENEQLVATLYSKDNKDNVETVIATSTATSENTDITFTSLTSEMTYILELKNNSDEAVDIDCLISQ